MVRGERSRDEAPAEELGRDVRGALRRPEVDEEEVRHGRADVPPGRPERIRQAVPLRVDAGHVRLHLGGIREGLGDDGHGDRRHGSRRTKGHDPGNRLGTRDREPDPQPGQPISLARGPDDDEVRMLEAEIDE